MGDKAMSCISEARRILKAEKDEGLIEIATRRMHELTALKERVEALEALGVDALRTLAEAAPAPNTIRIKLPGFVRIA